MKKTCSAVISIALLLMMAGPARAANLTAVAASVLDASGVQRTTFSTAESVTLRQRVNNAATSPNPIVFSFTIENQAGAVLFTQTGNSVPGTLGGAQSQLAGILIKSFYSSPGTYTFKGKAELAGETPVVQSVSFQISSPNITLIYPPHGARGLVDKPLIFRWLASGATRYRVTVADNSSLYNPAYTAVNTGDSFYAYPANPSQPREQLVGDQVYYWKIEGLDSNNNVISESNIYNFSLKSQAVSQARNISIFSLDLAGPVSDFAKPFGFKAVVYNGGTAAESNIGVKMSMGGMPAQDSPKQIMSIAPGEKRELSFTAFMPQDQSQSLAVVCADLFDDNMQDNCKTQLISKAAGPALPPPTVRKLSYDEMFQEILKRLGPDAAKTLEGYTFANLSCADCSMDDIMAIIAALMSGTAELVDAKVTNPPSTGPNTVVTAQPSDSSSDRPEEITLDLSEDKKSTAEEWTGYTSALKLKKAAYFVFKDISEWKKLWKIINQGDAPEPDLRNKLIVGVIASQADNADSVRFLGNRRNEQGLVFDYYVVEAPEERKPGDCAYIFKLYDKTDNKIIFNRLNNEEK